MCRRKSRGSQNRDPRYGASEVLGWQVVDLEEIRRVWVCLVFFLGGCAGSLACWPGVGGRRWTAGWHSTFVQHISYLGILARGILALGWLAQYMRIGGVRIELTAGGWGWRGLAGGCCCEDVA